MRLPDRLQLPMLIIILFLFFIITYKMLVLLSKYIIFGILIICLAEKWYSKYILGW
jgi:Sec-independent protein secretion pathway component TatC